MDALAFFMVLGIGLFGTHWLDFLCDFVLMPILVAIFIYRGWLLVRGVPWHQH